MALALHHGSIPPSLNHETPNPAIPWTELPLIIPRSRAPWAKGSRRLIAGVSAFEIAGTNAHVVLEEAPGAVATLNVVRNGPVALLPLSAKSPDALRALAARFADLLESDSTPDLQSVCWSAATRRTALDYRAVFVAADRAAIVEGLWRYTDGGAAAAEGVVHADAKPRIAFVCPGQGAQWVGMARELMAQEPVFHTALQRCDAAARPFVDWSIIEQLSLQPGISAYRLDEIGVIQPVLVAIAIAYADLLRSLGIEPAAVVGHSMGEVAAACIAGVLDLDQAMHVICRRSALMQRTSGKGAMALVDLSMEEIAARLVGREDRLSVAASNSPRSSVISGDPEVLQQVMTELESENVFCRLVKVDVASHSPQMEPLARELAADLVGLMPSEARIPIWSTMLGRRAEGREFDAAYWGCNLSRTVRFTDAVSQLLEEGVSIFVELGPHPVLLHAVTQTAQALGHEAITVACGRREEKEQAAALVALGQLWAAGYPVEWDRVMPDRGPIVSLPLYPWQRSRHWPEGAEIASSSPQARAVSPRPDAESRGWLFGLQWELSDVPAGRTTLPPDTRWLVLSVDSEAGSALTSALASAGGVATAAPLERLETAIADHARGGASSSGIILVAPEGPDAPFLPVRALQAVLKSEWRASPRLWLVTRGGQPVATDRPARVSVDQAALWGAGRVIAEEHPNLWGGLVDLDPATGMSANAALFVLHLLATDAEDQIALRANRRYALRLVPEQRDGGSETFVWRRNATYLITGGLGDVGLHLARALVARGVRRLVLMSRTPLPPREGWDKATPESSIGRRIASVRALEAEGVAVHLAAVDVSDEYQLHSFLDRFGAEGWPPIRGVIHAAGSVENQLADAVSQGRI